MLSSKLILFFFSSRCSNFVTAAEGAGEAMSEIEALQSVQAVAPPRPVFFMHIAKTAGSYVNSLFETALGADRVATHIETCIGGSDALATAIDGGILVFSGHVMFGLWRDIEGPLGLDFLKVTVVRDPIEHLASHIRWLDHYNNPEKRQSYRALDEHHQRVVDRVGAIDFNDVGQLDRFLTNLTPAELRLFDNCQSRYFISSGRRTLDACRPLSLADCRALRTAMEEFDVIARQDRFETDIQRIAETTRLPLVASDTRVNVAKSPRQMDTSNPLVRQVLGKRTLVDQWMWRTLSNG